MFLSYELFYRFFVYFVKRVHKFVISIAIKTFFDKIIFIVFFWFLIAWTTLLINFSAWFIQIIPSHLCFIHQNIGFPDTFLKDFCYQLFLLSILKPLDKCRLFCLFIRFCGRFWRIFCQFLLESFKSHWNFRLSKYSFGVTISLLLVIFAEMISWSLFDNFLCVWLMIDAISMNYIFHRIVTLWFIVFRKIFLKI